MDAADHHLGHAEHRANLSLFKHTICQQLADIADVGFGELAAATVPFTSRHALWPQTGRVLITTGTAIWSCSRTMPIASSLPPLCIAIGMVLSVGAKE